MLFFIFFYQDREASDGKIDRAKHGNPGRKAVRSHITKTWYLGSSLFFHFQTA